ncbi:MAG TPA: aldo/keto reductase [Vicinamibacterales bacterium]|nr:aldo/keto reductase [Vicinamibacterales bacterium]
MRYRAFGRTGWEISEIGYGMWGMGGWTGSDDDVSRRSLALAVESGCNFFDTASAYGLGRSERLLGDLLRAYPDRRLYVATKVAPKNMKWPAKAGDALNEVFPAGHLRASTEASLKNLGIDTLDLQQLHVWHDNWAGDERWQREVSDLKREGLIRAFGISVNRWEPANVLRALETDLVDCVQVVYNIFDQAPEDELFPACRRRHVAVIARVPFDEGSLTGRLTPDARWPDGDWRNVYFSTQNLAETLPRVERLSHLVPEGMDLPELALRFILANPDVTTTIPGMRMPAHVERNLAASDGRPLPPRLHDALGTHRWDRTAVIE